MKAIENTNEKKHIQYAVGRRKRASARVRMYEGEGKVTINGKSLEKLGVSKIKIKEVFDVIFNTELFKNYDFSVKVVGGGVYAQLEAARHGIARCIAKLSDDAKQTMRKLGLLTRDPREKERKKVYLVRARKAPQYSKR